MQICKPFLLIFIQIAGGEKPVAVAIALIVVVVATGIGLAYLFEEMLGAEPSVV